MKDAQSSKEQTASENNTPKSKKQRSPAYPAIDLEASISKAATLWEKAKRHPVSLDTAAGYWGFTAKSSAGLSTVSALKKFGLLEELEAGNGRSVKLTESAIQLVYNPDKGSTVYLHALKMAALLPEIHANLWQKYEGNLPDDAVISRHLVIDRKFNEAYVAAFISQFKRTIEFAKLSDGDTIQETETSGLKTNQESASTTPKGGMKWVSGGTLGGMSPVRTAQKQNEQMMTGDIPIFLGEGKFVKIPYPITDDDFTFLLDQLKAMKSRLVKKLSAIPPSVSLPAKAIWKNGDTDKPVKIVALMGKQDDGEMYYQSDDGTGIPASQLIFDEYLQ